jgi:hypothetical protein
MIRFVERIKSLLARRAPSGDKNPLNYDDLIHLDAEDLAEQGVLSAYNRVLPELSQYTASPLTITEEIDTDSARYSVQVAGRNHEIWESGAKNQDGWERATVALFEAVNASLASTPYKFYALYGGNDLGGMFLTQEQFASARRALNKRSEWPWLPVNEPPHYGYPVEGAA